MPHMRIKSNSELIFNKLNFRIQLTTLMLRIKSKNGVWDRAEEKVTSENSNVGKSSLKYHIFMKKREFMTMWIP